MENFFARYRNTSILVAVLFAQVLGLAVQIKRPAESGSTRLIRVWVVSTVSPIERALVSTGRGMRGVWHDYIYLRGVRRENRELREEVERMRIEQVRLQEDAAQARRLQALLGFHEPTISGTVAAQVIGTSGSDLSRVLYIDKGSKDGIKPDMAVITPDGIVGKVLRVFSHTSQVLEINDASSGVGAILEKSRLQGILQGTAAGETVMRYVMSDERVESGERVLTSGGDRIFPKGLPIGTVTQSSPGHDLFLNIRVKPAANLSKIEEVLVVTKIEEKAPQAVEPSGPVRAADILAERLPSIPKKPADGAQAPPKPGTTTATAGATTATAGAKPSSASTNAAAGQKPANLAQESKPLPATTAAGGGTTAKPAVQPASPSNGTKPAASTQGGAAKPGNAASATHAGAQPAQSAASKPVASTGPKPAATAPTQNAASKPANGDAPPKTAPAANGGGAAAGSVAKPQTAPASQTPESQAAKPDHEAAPQPAVESPAPSPPAGDISH